MTKVGAVWPPLTDARPPTSMAMSPDDTPTDVEELQQRDHLEAP